MRLIYVGNAFMPGVPARDLEAHEVDEYGGAKKLLATGLYVEDKEEKPAAGKKAADKDGK